MGGGGFVSRLEFVWGFFFVCEREREIVEYILRCPTEERRRIRERERKRRKEIIVVLIQKFFFFFV